MRFSLMSLFILTAVIAVYCGVLFAMPAGLSASLLIASTGLVIPSATVAGIVYGRGHVRAFFIGCTASCGLAGLVAVYFVSMVVMSGNVLQLFTSNDSELAELKWGFAILHALAMASGLIAIGIRWLCLRGSPSPNITARQPSPTTVLIDPRDKAELYAILQGRMASGVESNGSDANRATTGIIGNTG